MSEANNSFASTDDWTIRSGKLYIPFLESFKNGNSRKSNLIFSLDGKFQDQVLLHYGDSNQLLKTEFLHNLLSKSFLCSEDSFKKANEVFCEDKKIPDEGLYIVKSAVDPSVDEKMGLVLDYQEHRKAFLDLQKDYPEWDVIDSSSDTVVLKTFLEEASAEEDGPIFFALNKLGFKKLDLPHKIQIFKGKNCRDLKYDANEMDGFSSVDMFNLEKEFQVICSENLAKNVSKGRVFLRTKDKITRYDLLSKKVKVYDMSSLFQREWKGKAFINSFKNFSEDILVASVIYNKKGSWLAEKSYLVKDDRVPSFIELKHKPVHFFSKDRYLACAEHDDEEKELPLALTLIDLKQKQEEKVFNTGVKLYGLKQVEGLDINALDDRAYACSDRSSVVSKYGEQVFIADKYYTQKAKYPLNEDMSLNVQVLKAINFFKVDYKHFCGLSRYENFPYLFPVMNKESNYDKFCNLKDGILMKSTKSVYDKPKELFLVE